MHYRPTLESLRQHRVPQWYDDAKFGIFIHWGLFSVPAFAADAGDIADVLKNHYDDAQLYTPYSEWYPNAIKFPESAAAKHHRETYGQRPYESFRDEFVNALENWDPDDWADLFARAGARYVVLVTKHHDGFCLWPSHVDHAAKRFWKSARDIVGELASAVRRRNMRFGIYYSGGIDWSFDPTPVRTVGDFLATLDASDEYCDYADRQVRELIELYEPSVLWNDIGWPARDERLWCLIADYYNAVEEGVVNDRWATPGWFTRALKFKPFRKWADRSIARRLAAAEGGLMPPKPPHFDFRTPEYSTLEHVPSQKWEACRGIGRSFGWNRNEPLGYLLSADELVDLVIGTVAFNGNLLLNVGPRGEDASIPKEQRERLEALGTWLKVNGEAIYGTRPWEVQKAHCRDGSLVRFTHKGDTVFMHHSGAPSGPRIVVDLPHPERFDQAELLGRGPVEFGVEGGKLAISWPESVGQAPAHVFALSCPGEGAVR